MFPDSMELPIIYGTFVYSYRFMPKYGSYAKIHLFVMQVAILYIFDESINSNLSTNQVLKSRVTVTLTKPKLGLGDI
jgi:hypothetical protein